MKKAEKKKHNSVKNVNSYFGLFFQLFAFVYEILDNLTFLALKQLFKLNHLRILEGIIIILLFFFKPKWLWTRALIFNNVL